MKKYQKRLKIYHYLDNKMVANCKSNFWFELFNHLSVWFYKIFISWKMDNVEIDSPMRKYNFVKTIRHPKAQQLSVNIFENDGMYFYEEDGDWFDNTMSPRPLIDCEKDALSHLDSVYNGGSSRTIGEISENQTFNIY